MPIIGLLVGFETTHCQVLTFNFIFWVISFYSRSFYEITRNRSFLLLVSSIYANAISFISPRYDNQKNLKDELRLIQSYIPINIDIDFKDLANELVLDLQLSEDLKIKAIRFKIEKDERFNYWKGKIANDPYGRLIIVFNDDSIAIELTTGDKHFWLLQRPSGYNLVESSLAP